MIVNFLFSFYYIGTMPHMGGKTKYYQEAHNELMIIVLCYHMFIFTNFMPQQDGKTTGIFVMGNSFIFCIVEILVVNIIIIFKGFVKDQITDRIKERSQKAYEARWNYFKFVQQKEYFERCEREQMKMVKINEKYRNADPFNLKNLLKENK